jgi:hypothetical protein
MPRFTAPERDEIYRHAARQARAAAEHIRHCAHTDPAAAADAAWAAADTLHVAARALHNPSLRCAADSYDRAARAAYGRIPRRSYDGDQLRRTARMIALAGNLTGDNTLMAIALMAQLVALAAAVAELRQAQWPSATASAAAETGSSPTRARTRFSPSAQPRPRWAAVTRSPTCATHQPTSPAWNPPGNVSSRRRPLALLRQRARPSRPPVRAGAPNTRFGTHQKPPCPVQQPRRTAGLCAPLALPIGCGGYVE